MICEKKSRIWLLQRNFLPTFTKFLKLWQYRIWCSIKQLNGKLYLYTFWYSEENDNSCGNLDLIKIKAYWLRAGYVLPRIQIKTSLSAVVIYYGKLQYWLKTFTFRVQLETGVDGKFFWCIASNLSEHKVCA